MWGWKKKEFGTQPQNALIPTWLCMKYGRAMDHSRATLISAEKYNGISPNFSFAGQRSVAATKELQEQMGRKRWLVSHYGEPTTTATDGVRQDRGDLYTLPGLLHALPMTLAGGQ